MYESISEANVGDRGNMYESISEANVGDRGTIYESISEANVGDRGTIYESISEANVAFMMQYDNVYLTCGKTLMDSQLSLPHEMNKKCKKKTDERGKSGPVPWHEASQISEVRVGRIC